MHSDFSTMVGATAHIGCVTGCRCAGLGDAAAWPIHGLIKHFRPEMERRIVERGGILEAAE